MLMIDGLIGILSILWTRLVYRLRTRGTENVPSQGPAIVVVNHTSLVDRLIVYASLPRRAWFYGSTKERYRPIWGTIWRALRSDEPEAREDLAESNRLADEALARGEIVCIFPEGKMTRLGHLLPFTKEFADFLSRHPDVPTIPTYIHGNWISMFSYYRYRYLGKWPRFARNTITIAFGKPLPASVGSVAIRSAVQESSAEAYEASRYDRLPVHRQMIYTSKKFSRRLATADSNTPGMNYGTMLMRVAILTGFWAESLMAASMSVSFFPHPSAGNSPTSP